MTRRKAWSALKKKLTGSIAQGFRRQPAADRNSSLAESHATTDISPPSPFSPTTTASAHHHTPNMADGEEDYSALPLTDRWVHKVRSRPLHPCHGFSVCPPCRANSRWCSCRSGKFANKHTRMLQNNSSSPPTNTTPPSGRSSSTHRFGRAPWLTAMSPPSRMG